MSLPADAEVERFARLIERRVGWLRDPGRRLELARTLAECVGQAAPGDWLDRLEQEPATGEAWRPAVTRLTVGESYFFRNPAQWEVFERERPCSILCAGCARGEEPYTAAMIFEQLGLQGTITGVDLDPAHLATAEAGVYGEWALRGTPPEYRERCFTAAGRDRFGLVPQVRGNVRFELANLLERPPWPDGVFDAVFCRNTLMYLVPDAARRIVGKLAAALRPGGLLFVGHAETLRGLSSEFELCQSEGAFYYRRLAGRRAPAPAAPALVASPPPDTRWIDQIERSARRIEELLPRAEPAPAQVDDPLASAREAYGREAYGEAIDQLALLAPAHGEAPEALLLRAAILTNRAEFDAARAVLDRLLALDRLHPGAHYLVGLGCVPRGEREAALRAFRSAVYLEPRFALGHFQLGCLARACGDAAGSQRALSRALELLPGEDDARLLLFGGGFGREALAAACRAELRALGVER